MTLTLYNNKSDEIVVGKNLEPLHEEFSCYFKENTDIIKPTIIVDYANVPHCNYLYLSEVERFYFIRNRIYSQGRVYLICEEDVLMSYRSSLLAQECVIRRQESLFDQKQNDDEWRVEGYTATRTIPFPEGMGFDMGTQEFVLGIAGGVGNVGS